MFLAIDHCAIPPLEEIPPLEPWHSWAVFAYIIKSHLDEVPFPHNGDNMVNN